MIGVCSEIHLKRTNADFMVVEAIDTYIPLGFKELTF
jgi:hypothetical protein